MRSDARAAATATALLLALAGCARTTLERSVVDDQAADEQAFWTGLETKRVVTNNDALHGLFLSADGADANQTYDERLADARRRQWITDSVTPETHPANQSATVGDLSVVACRIGEIKGGLTMRLLGPSPRYATKELIYMGILPDRAANQSMTGLEFIDFVGRVQDRAKIASGEIAPASPAAPPPQGAPPPEERPPEPRPDRPAAGPGGAAEALPPESPAQPGSGGTA